jgi:uncharacterized protein (TIGR02246 family)
MTENELAAAYTEAWNTGRPEAVSAFFAADGAIIINNGSPWEGHDRVAEMAAGFYTDIPDLNLTCDGLRKSGNHLVYLWTFVGTHAGTGKTVKVTGWEEWDLDAGGAIKLSRGWFDSEDYGRQTRSL